MYSLLISVLLFGFLHPTSKYFLDSGLNIFSFTFLFVFIRLLVQLPIFISKVKNKGLDSQQLKYICFLGLAGAMLQLLEFAGIALGMSISKVVFLVYLHPIWSVFISHFWGEERFNKKLAATLTLGISGILLIFF